MELFFRKIGEGKPLVILHGLFGLSDNWASMAKRLAEDGCAVYLLDLPNHGQSPHTSEFSYQQMSNALLEFLQAQNLQHITLLGHSMGGKVAMLFACQNPQLVKQLIVVDISPRHYPIHHQQVLDALNSLDLKKIVSRKQAEEALNKAALAWDTKMFLLKNLYWQKQGDGTEHLAWRFNLALLNKEIEKVGEALAESAKFDGPTLFISGAKSDYIQRKDVDLIAGHFPKAEFEIVENAGHWVQAENPEGFYTAINKKL